MENYTPFPNLRFFNTDNAGREFGVLLVKGTYEIQSNGQLKVSEDQEPLVLTDTYHGALNTSSLFMPSDLVPYKPRADIVLNAVARAPGGAPLPSWLCGVRVEGRYPIEKQLRVTGPRHWQPAWSIPEKLREVVGDVDISGFFKGWTLSDPEPVTEVPLHYELAYGGLQPRSQEGEDEPFYEADERNPAGRGWIDPQTTSMESPVPAPQIENPAEPIVDPYVRYTPQGFGPIPPAWLPRRPLGGTYDEHWKTNVWPKWPADYDFAYHNSAAAGLVYPGFLAGDERVSVFGLDGRDEARVLYLPRQAIVVRVQREGGGNETAVMRLDTLFLDIADADPAAHRAFLSWRILFDPNGIETLSFAPVRLLADPVRSEPALPPSIEEAAAK